MEQPAWMMGNRTMVEGYLRDIKIMLAIVCFMLGLIAGILMAG